MEVSIKCPCGRQLQLQHGSVTEVADEFAPALLMPVPVVDSFDLKKMWNDVGFVTNMLNSDNLVIFQALVDAERLRWIQQILHNQFHKLTNFGRPQLGSTAAVLIVRTVYRVEVVECEDSQSDWVLVRLIDFGQVDRVMVQHLKILPRQLVAVKGLANCGTMATSHSQEKKVLKGLRKAVNQGRPVVLKIDQRETPNSQRVVIRPQSVLPASCIRQAQVLQILSPSKFYVRFFEDLNKLAAMQKSLETQYKVSGQVPKTMVNCGSIYGVSRDGQFCRVKILGKSGEILRVLFIDMGVEDDISENVRNLSDTLVDTPPLAFALSVSSIQPMKGSKSEWSAEEISRFREAMSAADGVVSVENWETVQSSYDAERGIYTISDLLVNVARPSGVRCLVKMSQLNSEIRSGAHG